MTGLSDVARAAGTSVATASIALGTRAAEHRIAPGTVQRVRAAASRLGYIPNHAARSLRQRRTNMLAWVTSALDNPYVCEVAAAATEAGAREGYTVTLFAADSEARELAILDRLRNGTTDAVISASPNASVRTALARVAASGLPCLILQGDPAEDGLPCVSVDLAEGGRLAAHHLLELGHRRIAAVVPVQERMQPNGRMEAFARTLQQAGVACDLVAWGGNSAQGGYAAMHDLLARPAAAQPSAVFAYNDFMATGVLHAARDAGLRVPADVAVLGFDGIALGAFTNPELSTIVHPRRELGEGAIAAITRLLAGTPPGVPPRLGMRLLVRESCGGVRPPES